LAWDFDTNPEKKNELDRKKGRNVYTVLKGILDIPDSLKDTKAERYCTPFPSSHWFIPTSLFPIYESLFLFCYIH